jgi:hypothetical protein
MYIDRSLVESRHDSRMYFLLGNWRRGSLNLRESKIYIGIYVLRHHSSLTSSEKKGPHLNQSILSEPDRWQGVCTFSVRCNSAVPAYVHT